MWGQIPQHIDVVLVEAEVQPGGVDVVDLPEIPILHDLVESDDSRVVLERVADHQRHLLGGCGLDERSSIGRGQCQGLLDEYVLARIDRLQGQIEMCCWWRRNDHGVDIVDGGRERVGSIGAWKCLCDCLPPFGVCIDRDDALYFSNAMEHAHVL